MCTFHAYLDEQFSFVPLFVDDLLGGMRNFVTEFITNEKAYREKKV